jgi:hypothetical protein
MQQLIQIRDLIYRVAGIFHADNKLRLMEDRCQKRMTALSPGAHAFRYSVREVGEETGGKSEVTMPTASASVDAGNSNHV